MNIDFNSINQHIISLAPFQLLDGFMDDFLKEHFEQLQPLDNDASKFLWNYLIHNNVHTDVPFKKGLFQTIDKAKVLHDNQKEIKKWLYQRGIPFDKIVYLSWRPTEAMVVPWKILIKYFDTFLFYLSDLTIFDESLNWALLFYHEDEVYFGTNEKFKPSNLFPDSTFSW